MYTVTNCHGLPMCGYETLKFDEWEELEAYAEEHADDFDNGYATVFETY